MKLFHFYFTPVHPFPSFELRSLPLNYLSLTFHPKCHPMWGLRIFQQLFHSTILLSRCYPHFYPTLLLSHPHPIFTPYLIKNLNFRFRTFLKTTPMEMPFNELSRNNLFPEFSPKHIEYLQHLY